MTMKLLSERTHALSLSLSSWLAQKKKWVDSAAEREERGTQRLCTYMSVCALGERERARAKTTHGGSIGKGGSG